MESPFAKLAGLREQLPPAEAPDDSVAPATSEPDEPASRVIVRRERSGRGGKTVTFLEGLPGDTAALKALAKRAGKALGCGARVEGNAIVLQGDLEERIVAWLEAQKVAKRIVSATASRPKR